MTYTSLDVLRSAVVDLRDALVSEWKQISATRFPKSGGKSEKGKDYNSAFDMRFGAITYTFVHVMYLWSRRLFYRLHTEATGEVMLLNVGGNAECVV